MQVMLERQLEEADRRWLDYWLTGPRQTRLDTLPPQVGDPAPDIELVDSNGRPARVSQSWTDAPAHLFFMRQYGCGCMKERWAQLQDDYPRLREAGVNLVPIGRGEPERTRRFMEVRQIPVPVLCDPEGRAYDAYGVIEGTVATILHDHPWKPGDEEAGRKLMESRRDSDLRLVDNPWTLPLEVIVDRHGIIRHVHRYQYCEDFPPVSVLLGAVRSLA
jgi:peroxiredoxin